MWFLCIVTLKKEAAYFLETSNIKYKGYVFCSHVCEESRCKWQQGGQNMFQSELHCSRQPTYSSSEIL
jgi:hypothetical protein